MKTLMMEQGGAEWRQARIGLPTCSRLDEVITPAKLKPSSSQAKYRNQLLAEWLVGYPLDFGVGPWMERGTELEAEARKWYEFHRDVSVEQVGLLLLDDESFGGSPDGLIGEDGGLEIKCPALHTHVGYLLDPSSLATEYRSQVQGYLYLTGREWWDIIAYNPDLPAVVQRIKRDVEYLAALEPVLAAFIEDLEAARETLAPHRFALAAVEVPA